MGLGLNTGGNGDGGSTGDRLPYVKYNAKAGRMYLVDRSHNASTGTWETSEREVTPGFTAVFDMAGIEVGWIHYTSDQGPVRQLVPLGQTIGPRPVAMVANAEGQMKNGYKSGFNVLMVLSKADGGSLREMNSNAGCVVDAISQLHDAYLAGASANPGKFPVVKFVQIVKEKAGKSENYKPVFEITGWVDKPAAFNRTSAPANVVTRAAPPTTGATQVKAPELVEEDEFQ